MGPNLWTTYDASSITHICHGLSNQKESVITEHHGKITHVILEEVEIILTHWGQDKMATIFQTTFQAHFLEWKCMISD